MDEWGVSRQELSELLGISLSTINHWFSDGSSRRSVPQDVKILLAQTHATWLKWKAEEDYLPQHIHSLYELAIARKRNG